MSAPNLLAAASAARRRSATSSSVVGFDLIAAGLEGIVHVRMSFTTSRNQIIKLSVRIDQLLINNKKH